MSNAFVRRFTSAWLTPSPERLVELLHPDVVLYQPHRRPIHGKPAAQVEFERLLQWLPGLHSLVLGACAEEDRVFIEHELVVPLKHRRISIPAVDRFRLQDGLGIERVVYFDQVRLGAAIARHPQLWRGYLRYRAT